MATFKIARYEATLRPSFRLKRVHFEHSYVFNDNNLSSWKHTIPLPLDQINRLKATALDEGGIIVNDLTDMCEIENRDAWTEVTIPLEHNTKTYSRVDISYSAAFTACGTYCDDRKFLDYDPDTFRLEEGADEFSIRCYVTDGFFIRNPNAGEKKFIDYHRKYVRIWTPNYRAKDTIQLSFKLYQYTNGRTFGKHDSKY